MTLDIFSGLVVVCAVYSVASGDSGIERDLRENSRRQILGNLLFVFGYLQRRFSILPS